MTVMYNAQRHQKIFGLHYWSLGNKYILIIKEKPNFGFHILSPSGINVRKKKIPDFVGIYHNDL